MWDWSILRLVHSFHQGAPVDRVLNRKPGAATDKCQPCLLRNGCVAHQPAFIPHVSTIKPSIIACPTQSGPSLQGNSSNGFKVVSCSGQFDTILTTLEGRRGKYIAVLLLNPVSTVSYYNSGGERGQVSIVATRSFVADLAGILAHSTTAR
jgi:hypothetical protein